MRKNASVFVSIFLMLFVFVACSGEVEVPHASNVRFTTEIGRKVMADSAWQAGDEVGIYMVEHGALAASDTRANKAYRADASSPISGFSPVDDANTLTWDDFAAGADSTFDFISYYPYVSSISDTSALPIDVYPDFGEQDTGKADFLWGHTDTVQNNTPMVQLKLDHILSHVVVNIAPSDSIDKAIITEDGATLTATVKGVTTHAAINLNTGTVTPRGDDAASIHMKDISDTLSQADQNAGKRRFEAVLIPMAHTRELLDALELEFVLTDARGSSTTYTWTPSSVAENKETLIHFDAGKQHVYNMMLTTTTSHVAVAAIDMGIVAWDDCARENWEDATSYSISFDANGAVSGDEPERVVTYEGCKITLPGSGTLEKSGYFFAGWNTEADGSGTQYAAGDTFMIPGQDVTLYAIWVEKNQYSISFDASGATGGSSPGRMYAHEGSQLTLPGNGTLEKSGYFFAGWNTEIDGSRDSYAAGDSFVIPGQDVTLYAIWVENQYSVSFDGNGATSGDEPERVVTYKGCKVTLPTPGTLEKDIHYFYGWNTEIDSSGDSYVAGESFTMPADDVTLYAQWLVKIKAVSAGDYYTIILKMDGTLWATGQNTYGQLGDGTLINRYTPVQVKASTTLNDFMTDVVAVSTGERHTMILKKDGTLWATGKNYFGQLGLGSQEPDRSTPTQVTFMGTDVAAVSTGHSYTMILKKDDTLWATGFNSYGQLGDGTTSNRTSPVQVKASTTLNDFMTDVAAVSTGDDHTMILKKDGTLWAIGRNYSGQLGDDTQTDRSTPVQVTSMGTDVAAVSAGGNHTLILKKDGTLWVTGYNGFGQLGDSTTDNRNMPVQVKGSGGVGFMTDVKAASAGMYHTMILKKDGTLWATGGNEFGQLGLGDSGSETSRSIPVQITSMGNDVADVSTGRFHTMILKKDGTLWATGRNNFAQLGNGGDTSVRTTPVQIIF
ncbi:InlB B-repeat-containing protein [Parasphaerochaeta coccoides]|uniref:Cell wall/surface repeat protein n=1 Tax=Parasphaerochaeta coccoides (strain ATCC BAA-1237 / DSM 17374 / SPN1) TaxID=760011 RepID=F4GHM4_PARC1|nr:InlB B-repeat-containing protein [Parasphaerochaeta coccoides]AEC01562.1 cell wall/surface repeat protein [Parasphaerochaeta coccoides DSM 17374]